MMKLFQLAYACRIYGGLTLFDAGYHTLLDKTGGKRNFGDPSHVKALLVWLNSWGCRQFAVDYHDLAIESIRGWAQRWESRLPDGVMTLERLSDKEIEEAGNAYADISKSLASRRSRTSGPIAFLTASTRRRSAAMLFAIPTLSFTVPKPWERASTAAATAASNPSAAIVAFTVTRCRTSL